MPVAKEEAHGETKTYQYALLPTCSRHSMLRPCSLFEFFDFLTLDEADQTIPCGLARELHFGRAVSV